jgi:ribonuclease BN (tRNA processing enzyme)
MPPVTSILGKLMPGGERRKRVTFCGTGGGAFTAERASSGVAVEHAGHTVLLECGPGVLRGAMRAGIRPEQVGAVVLSHTHLDHVLDLAAFVLLQRFGGWLLPPVFGPPGTAGVVGAATGFVATTPLSRPTALAATTEIAGHDEREVCGFVMRSEETPHAPEVVAAVRRLTADGKRLVYSGDTQANPDTFVPLAAEVDLLVHECFSAERLERHCATLAPAAGERLHRAITGTHTEVREAAAIARDAGVPRLVLTHVPSWDDPRLLLERAVRVFPGEVLVACDGLVLDL